MSPEHKKAGRSPCAKNIGSAKNPLLGRRETPSKTRRYNLPVLAFHSYPEILDLLKQLPRQYAEEIKQILEIMIKSGPRTVVELRQKLTG